MRLELNRKTDLALRALLTLSRAGRSLKRIELAERVGTTDGFISQVMNPLVRRGWVASERGPSGGYRMNADASSITVLDLIEAVEGPTDDGRCVLRGTPCPAREQCALHDAWTRARGALLAQLTGTTVSDLLSS
jgi:Rrf2 family protein